MGIPYCALELRENPSPVRSRLGVSMAERELVHGANCAAHHSLCGAARIIRESEKLMAKESSRSDRANTRDFQKHEDRVYTDYLAALAAA